MVSFRLATLADQEMVLQMMEEFYAIDGYPFNKEKSAQNFEAITGNPALGLLWVVQENKAVIGYACLTFGFSFEYGGRNAFIDELFLKPAYRKKGIGKAVLAFIEQQAIDNSVNTLHLEVEQHNEGGKRLYSGRGFNDTGRHLFAKRLQ